MTHELVKSVSITNLLQQRQACIERITQAVALLRDAAVVAQAGRLGAPRVRFEGGYKQRSIDLTTEAALPALIKEVDAGAWQYLMHESGLRSLMDSGARRKWDESIAELNVPALTAENIEATFAALHDARADMFDRGVIECFRRLSWDYKTNSPVKFGKKVILDFLASNYGGSGLHFNQERCNHLDDLCRVFHVLDGQPEPDHRDGYYCRLYSAEQQGTNELDGDYMRVRFYKKGSGHVLFKRTDLVERMNGILAKHHPNALAADLR